VQSLLNNTFTPNRTFVSGSVLDSSLPSTIDIKTGKVDYLHPLKNGGKLEAGLKSSFISTANVADFYDVVGEKRNQNYEFSNNFKYNENINAAYVNYSIEGKRWGFQAGLRFENTNVKGNQLGNKVVKDSSFTRSYDNLFPTLYVSYKLDTTDTHQLGFSYGRRIDRPDYQSMNPFTYPMDRFTLYGGNPFLRPTFSNNFELSHTYKNKITTSIEYSYTQDVITETIEQGSNIFYSRPGNLGENQSLSLNFSGSVQPAKWWTLQFYTSLNYNKATSLLYGQPLNNAGTYWVFAPNNLFQINKDWSAEFSISYQTTVYYGQFVLIPVWNTRIAVAKKILKGQGTLKFAASDLFYTNQPGGDIKGLANSTANWLSYLDSRVGALTFSWRFSKGQNLKVRQSGASESEQNRVKG
jgi:iron complex outermembrane recepter protein